MVTLATMMYEILLTRIFSVTIWYHFAFMAISIAMFGMTVGAILVYLFPNYFTQERAKFHLAINSLLFAILIVISFLIHLYAPFIHKSFTNSFFISLTYTITAIPFVFSGICVCIALTKFPRQVSKLYAADLAGAALGCILLIYTLKITDGPTAVIVVAFFACLGAVLFAVDGNLKKLLPTTLAFALFFASFTVFQIFPVSKQSPLIRLMWVKGKLEPSPLYEKWNSFSRIRVRGNPNRPLKPFGWGLSSTYSSDRKVRRLALNIDGTAGTVLIAFDGNLNKLEHLKYDVTNLVHYIRQGSKVLIIGTGGGRDILSALVFKQKSILGVEINKDIIDTTNKILPVVLV